MRVSILALGSRGDIQPALALAETLASHSHHIRFITHPGFAHLAVGRNVEFLPLAAMKGEFEHLAKKKRYPLFEFRATADMAKRYGLEWSRQFRALAEGSDCLVGAGVCSFMVPTVGRHAKIPFFQAFFQPILPTRSFSSVLLPSLPFALPGFANRLSHQIVNQLVWSFFRPTASESLRELWHEPAAPLLFQIDAARDPRCPTLMAFSRHVVPPPEDWGHSIEVTGYWFLDRQTGWQPPRDLADFIAAGPPPIYVGFGSMGSKNPAAITSLVLSAINKCGCRAIISSGWGNFTLSDAPSNIFRVDDLPHDWLFPRMASIVHHGGAGTTASALRAGVPSVIVPFLADQPFWGHRLRQLGVAPRAIPHHKMNVNVLAQALDCTLNNKDMRAKAADLGILIAAENGVKRAADLVEKAVDVASSSR